jgi:hypothetical protein
MSASATRTPIDRSVGVAETAFEAVAVFGFKDNQTGVEQFSLGDDDDVVAIRDLVTTENLSNQSFSSIPLNGPAQLAGDRDSQTSDREPVRQNEQRGVAPMDSRALFVDQLEVSAAANPLVGPEKSHGAFSGRLKATRCSQ